MSVFAVVAAIVLPTTTFALRLDPDTPWVLPPSTSTEASGLVPSMALALKDLRSDWYGVFGIQPLVLGTYFPYTDYIHQGPHAELMPPYPLPPADAIGPFVFLGTQKMLSQTLPPAAFSKITASLGTKPESHGCFVLDADPPGARRVFRMLLTAAKHCEAWG